MGWGYLDPVDFRGRDVSFFKESEYPSSECKSVIVSIERWTRYFESAAPIAEIDLWFWMSPDKELETPVS